MRKSIKIPAPAYERLREIASLRRMTISALITELAQGARATPPAAPAGYEARAVFREPRHARPHSPCVAETEP